MQISGKVEEQEQRQRDKKAHVCVWGGGPLARFVKSGEYSGQIWYPPF